MAKTARDMPLYERVQQYILTRVADGRLADGARVPSEHELADALGISRVTVNRAMHELSQRGLVSRVQGSGTFVKLPPAQSSLLEIRNIADEVLARGGRHRSTVVTLARMAADRGLAAFFGVRAGSPVFHSVVIHHENDTPIQLEERFVNPAFAPRYLQQDFTTRTTSEYLHTISLVTEVAHTVCAVRPDSTSRELLGVDAAEPCLELLRETWVGRMATSRSIFTYPGSRYRLGGRYRVGAVPTGA
jgi:GntR family histidine utilization transcriptional repressor